jgi:cell fate regulator YaaT (PSP1 superfamily)
MRLGKLQTSLRLLSAFTTFGKNIISTYAMSCDHNNKECRLDMGRGCMFCPEGRNAEAHGQSGTGESHREAGACVREGCFKLHETDWLADYPVASPTDIFEVRFKNTRRGYYKNIHNLPLRRGDIVAVEASPGHDTGIVSLTGDMVARQMRRTGFSPQNGEFRAIYRKAKPYDITRWQEAIGLEHSTMIRSRRIAEQMKLDMKIGDVEYQGDRIKAIFYYIADGRVDFRELIKVFASEFGIKVEMKQIGARQEAGRIGGLGSCGRELCCTSWIANFNSVTTGAARTQDISLNPQKLAGQCCKLKCCLAYELDAYIDARKSLPRVNGPLQAIDGDYWLVSSDVLRGTMSFSTVKGATVGNIVLSTDKVQSIVEMNRRGTKPATITGLAPVHSAGGDEPSFVNMVGEESITRFDGSRRTDGGRRRGRGGRRDGGNRDGGNRDGQRAQGSGGGNRDGQRDQAPRSGAEGASGTQRNSPNTAAPGSGRGNGEAGGNGGGENRGNRPESRQGNRGEGRQGNRGNNRGGRNRPPRNRDNKGEGKK